MELIEEIFEELEKARKKQDKITAVLVGGLGAVVLLRLMQFFNEQIALTILCLTLLIAQLNDLIYFRFVSDRIKLLKRLVKS